MSEKAAGREQLTRRSSFRRSLAETALPEEYLSQLEDKRRQLDESIHKYIAAKERDYKTYEKELRHQHRNAQGQDGPNGGSRRGTSPESAHGDGRAIARGGGNVAMTAPSTTRPDKEVTSKYGEDAEQLDRPASTGLKDRRTSLERDKDFVGVFTPQYLRAIDARDDRDLASSAPSAVTVVHRSEIGHHAVHLERANSDTIVQAKPKRPSQLALAHRTSSSGSSADGRLASAMKSPSQQPKRKRVSLAVGDSIVAPSDNVPAAPSVSNTPSHSKKKSNGADKHQWNPLPLTSKKDSQAIGTAKEVARPSGPVQASAEAFPSSGVDIDQRSSAADSASPLPTRSSTQSIPAGHNKLDPDGDLFDLEELEEVPINQSEVDDLGSALESDESDFDRPHTIAPSDDPLLDSDEQRYDPETGLIPIPSSGKDSTVPYSGFRPGSAVASQQPIAPGFRRPSVVHDPVFRGTDYRIAEKHAVEDDIYGSSFNRPTSKGSFTAGSLGESYMAQHAAEMETHKGRRRRQEGEVKS